MQEKIDACEAKAIEGADFTEQDIEFLRDLYTCLYKGARLTLVLPEVSKLMEHYLAGSGEALEVDASILHTNKKVIEQMELLKAKISTDSPLKENYRSEVFYMPDFSNIDSVFGLYYGHLEARPERTDGETQIDWRAEVPWEWPAYESLKAKHGDYHAESFPIPNASCLLRGIDGAIFIDNGLGEYLTRLGLAKSFLAYAEWTEVL
ncbi:MAG: hypothetical protein ACPGSB_10735 [Opitutales bacterium]